jgi:hypothetical protein
MSGRNDHPLRVLGVLALSLALAGHTAWAAEAKPTLEEKRLSVIKGTTPGIVILDLGSAKSTEPAASSNTAVGALPARDEAASARWLPKWLSTLPAPSGRPLQAARRLDAPDQGIPLPTAASASQARAGSPATP